MLVQIKTSLLFTICFVTIATFYMRNAVARFQCNPNSGPSGSKHCIKLSSYDDYQWVSCESESYIKETSRNRYGCRYSYCLYSCMKEKYGESGGEIKSQCQCLTPKKITTVATTLKPLCKTGSKECRKRARYNDYQWVTCASDSYVNRKTNGKYYCPLGYEYCNFNCMIEVYDKHSGDVTGGCRCSPGDLPPETFSSASQITMNVISCVVLFVTSFLPSLI